MNTIYYVLIYFYASWLIFDVQTRKYKNAKLISWVNNPPYYLSKEFRTDERHRGILLSILRQAESICYAHDSLKVIDDEEQHIEKHSDLLQLLLAQNTDKMLESINITQKDDELIIIGTTSYPHAENINRNFTMKTMFNAHSLAVIVNNKDTQLLVKFFSAVSKCINIIYFAVVMSILVAFFVWLFEHRSNKDIPDSFGQGLWTCFWLSFVTMTTVGYGDYVIKQCLTRIVAVCWMVFGLMITAMITATVLEEIKETVNTRGSDVAVLDLTSEAELIPQYLKGHALRLQSHSDVIKAVANGEAKVGLMDSNVAAAYFSTYNPTEVSIEREINVKIPVFIYLLTYKTVCHTDDLVTPKLMAGILTSYVSPLHLKPYHVQSITHLLDHRGNGLMVYMTVAAACLIAVAIILEIINTISEKRKKKIKAMIVDPNHKTNILIQELRDLIKKLERDQPADWNYTSIKCCCHEEIESRETSI